MAAPIDEGDEAPSILDEAFRDALEDTSDNSDNTTPKAPPEGLLEINAARKALSEGNVDACREKLRAAYAKAPNLPPPNLMFARLLLSAGHVAQGRAMLEQVAVSHPNHPDLYLMFGNLALADGHATDAALHFDRALSLESPQGWNELQQAYLERAVLEGRTTVAERRGDWKQASELYQQQVAARPKNAKLRDRFAMALFHAGELDRAFEQFDLSRLQDASMNPPEVSMAVMYVRKRNYEASDEWFAKALEKYEGEAAVHFEHSIAMLYQDRTQEAAASAAKAQELGMDTELLKMHRGLIALQHGDTSEAAKQFEKVLRESPDHVGAMTNLALLLSERKTESDLRRAQALAEKAGQAQPNSPEVGAVLGWVYYRNGRENDAQNLLRAAAAQSRRNPLSLFLYGRMLIAERKNDEAKQVAEVLKQRLEQPGLFVFRPAARRWVEKVLNS